MGQQAQAALQGEDAGAEQGHLALGGGRGAQCLDAARRGQDVPDEAVEVETVQLPQQVVTIQRQLYAAGQQHGQYRAGFAREAADQPADRPDRRDEQQGIAADQHHLVQQYQRCGGQVEEAPQVQGHGQPGEQPVEGVDATRCSRRHG
ncbi:hypothetical protein D9M71_673930 [compost metagenome]